MHKCAVLRLTSRSASQILANFIPIIHYTAVAGNVKNNLIIFYQIILDASLKLMIVSNISLYSHIYNHTHSVLDTDRYIQNIRKYSSRGKITYGENMPRKRLILKISSSEKEELENIINHENSSKRLVLRCKIILLTEKGIPLNEIAENLGLSRVTVNTWRQVYLVQGIEGLKVKQRLGRPSKIAKEILYSHFPGLDDNVSLSFKKALDMESKSVYRTLKLLQFTEL